MMNFAVIIDQSFEIIYIAEITDHFCIGIPAGYLRYSVLYANHRGTPKP